MTVARNRAIDRLRHERMRDARLREAAALIDDGSADEGEAVAGDDSSLPTAGSPDTAAEEGRS